MSEACNKTTQIGGKMPYGPGAVRLFYGKEAKDERT